MNLIDQNKHLIQKICAENQVSSLFAFGSVVRNQLQQNSDLDFVVEIQDANPLSYSDKYFNLKFELESLFKRTIDLLESKAIKNPFLKEDIDRTKILIYGK